MPSARIHTVPEVSKADSFKQSTISKAINALLVRVTWCQCRFMIYYASHKLFQSTITTCNLLGVKALALRIRTYSAAAARLLFRSSTTSFKKSPYI